MAFSLQATFYKPIQIPFSQNLFGQLQVDLTYPCKEGDDVEPRRPGRDLAYLPISYHVIEMTEVVHLELAVKEGDVSTRISSNMIVDVKLSIFNYNYDNHVKK